jgi:hypothetical protein
MYFFCSDDVEYNMLNVLHQKITNKVASIFKEGENEQEQ